MIRPLSDPSRQKIFMSVAEELEALIRTIPDYPKPGIMFRDITTLLQHPKGLRLSVDGIAEAFKDEKFDLVAGIEARGFILGGAVAYALGLGFVAIRNGQVRRHRAWMTRAYAIGLAAGTQALTLGFGQALFGKTALSRALLSGAGWLINVAVAEWSISRYRARQPQPRKARGPAVTASP